MKEVIQATFKFRAFLRRCPGHTVARYIYYLHTPPMVRVGGLIFPPPTHARSVPFSLSLAFTDIGKRKERNYLK
jgi:hypothetical protein